MRPETVAALLEQLKDILRTAGSRPSDLAIHDALRGRFREEFGAEPHPDVVAWFNFAQELEEPDSSAESGASQPGRVPLGLIAPMMRPYGFDEASETARLWFTHLREGGPHTYEAPAFVLDSEGRPVFVLIGSDESGFHYCLSPASSGLGTPRVFLIGEGDASFFIQMSGELDDSVSVRLHEEMPTLRLYLEALVRAYRSGPLEMSEYPRSMIEPALYFPWPSAKPTS
jgi:hypothetical protein